MAKSRDKRLSTNQFPGHSAQDVILSESVSRLKGQRTWTSSTDASLIREVARRVPL